MGGAVGFIVFVSFPKGAIIESNQNCIGLVVWDKLLTYVRKVQFGLGLKFKTGLRKLWLSVLVDSP